MKKMTAAAAAELARVEAEELMRDGDMQEILADLARRFKIELTGNSVLDYKRCKEVIDEGC